MFARFSSHEIWIDRFPSTETERKGVFVQLYNRGLVSLARALRAALIRPIGFYIIIKATK